MTSSSFTIYKKYSFRTYLSCYRRKGDGEEDGEKDLDGYFHIGWMKSGGYPLNKKSVEALLCQELWAEWQMMADDHWPGNEPSEMSWAQQTNTAQVRLAKEKQVRGGMWNKTNVRTTEPNHHQPVGSSSTESGTLLIFLRKIVTWWTWWTPHGVSGANLGFPVVLYFTACCEELTASHDFSHVFLNKTHSQTRVEIWLFLVSLSCRRCWCRTLTALGLSCWLNWTKWIQNPWQHLGPNTQ